MTTKDNSTDFWYALLDSLYNYGLARGELKEIDGETQEKLLAYLKQRLKRESLTDRRHSHPVSITIIGVFLRRCNQN